MSEPKPTPADVKRKLDQSVEEVHAEREQQREARDEAQQRAERLRRTATSERWKGGEAPE